MTGAVQRARSIRHASIARQRLVCEGPRKGSDGIWTRMSDIVNYGFGFEHFWKKTGKITWQEADILVTGDNPVLNAMAMRAAAGSGCSAILCQTGGEDSWPYNLMKHPLFRETLSRRMRLRVHAGEPLDVHAEHSFFERLFEEVAGAIAAKGASARNAGRLVPRMTNQSHEDEILVLFDRKDPRPQAEGLQSYAIGALRRQTRRFEQIDWRGAAREPVLFVRKIILTSNLPGFGSEHIDMTQDGDILIQRNSSFVEAFGTARLLPRSRESALRAAIEDIAALSEAKFLPKDGGGGAGGKLVSVENDPIFDGKEA